MTCNCGRGCCAGARTRDFELRGAGVDRTGRVRERRRSRAQAASWHRAPDPEEFQELFELSYQVGPIEQARIEAVQALDRTASALQGAIRERKAGRALPNPVKSAMTRFFQGSKPSDLERMLLRVKQVRGWLPAIPAQEVTSVTPFKDKTQNSFIAQHLTDGTVAWTFPPKVKIPSATSDYVQMIALYPPWTANAPHQPARLIHEAFHYSYYPGIRETDPPCSWSGAWAWQGLVCALGGLPLGPRLNSQCPRERPETGGAD